VRVAEAGPRDAVHDADGPDHPVARRPGRALEVALVCGTWLAGQLVFFRSQWLSGFDRSMGDAGAARFIVYVNENWYQALLGHASWKNPAFYYPLRSTLGLSDTFLLWQVVYAPARALGADPFLAYQLSLVFASAVGFATFYLLVRALWRPPVALGLLGATLFTFPNALYVNANHPQLFGVLLLPAPLLCFLGAWRLATRRRPAGIALGALAGALGVLVAYSTYYAGFFAALAVVVVLVLSVAVAPSALRRVVAALRAGGWKAVAGAIGGAVLPGALFLDTFLPALHAAGGYQLGAAKFFAPTLPDLVNVGTGNLLWGSALGHLLHGTAAGPERDYSVTPILLVTTLVAVVAATVLERRAQPGGAGWRYSSAVLATSALLLLLSPMVVGSAFLWRAVYWIPGASGIRAIDRIAVVASSLLVLALVDAGTRVWPWCTRRVPRGALVTGAVVLAALICLEQVNVADSSQLSRRTQTALLDAVPAPPPSCTAFFVETARGSTTHPARVQTTAMLLSVRFGVPTLNGTSGSFPPGWHLFYPTRPHYLANVRAWVHAHHIAGQVCALDLDTDRWRLFATGGPAASR